MRHMWCLAMGLVSPSLIAEEFIFDSALIHGGGGIKEISYLTDTDEGIRPLVIRINGKKEVFLQNVIFKKNSSKQRIEACFDIRQLKEIIDYNKEIKKKCIFLNEIDVNINFKENSRIGIHELIIPQYLLKKEINDIQPGDWTNGNNALVVNYSLNENVSNNEGKTNKYFYGSSQWKASFDSGYIIKSDLSLASERGDYKANNNYYYLQKDIRDIKSRMSLGTQYSNSLISDSYKFSGIGLRNDQEMWPESELLFRPAVDGIVNQVALIELYQGDVLIKRVQVQPGKYSINDYNPIYYGGDINVEVKNIEGIIINKYSVPYAGGGVIINKNSFIYSFDVGVLQRQGLKDENNSIYQFGIIYGVNDYFNLKYGNLQSSRYNLFVDGASFNTKLGLISTDIKMASAKPYHSKKNHDGYSINAKYQKNISTLKISSISVSSNLHNSTNYRTLDNTYSYDTSGQLRRDVSMQLNGTIMSGSFNVNYGVKEYWNVKKKEKYLSLGYTGSYKMATYGLSAFNSGSNKSTLLNFQIPLGGGYKSSIYSSYIQNGDGSNTKNVTYNHRFPEKKINTSVGVSEYNNNRKNINLSADYSGGKGRLNQSINYVGRKNLSSTTNITGSLIVIDKELHLMERISGTSALIKSEGLAKAKLINSGNQINSSGYGQVALTPYKKNRIEISSENTGLNVKIKGTTKKIIPIKDSVSLVEFETQNTNSIFLKFRVEDILKINFGDDIFNLEGAVIARFMQGQYTLVDGEARFDTLYYYVDGKRCEAKITKSTSRLLELDVYNVSSCYRY